MRSFVLLALLFPASLLAQVPARGDEEEPPVPVALTEWFPPGQDNDGPRES